MGLTLFEWLQKPFHQLLLFIPITLVCFLVTRQVKVDSAWTLAGLVYACFILVNSIFICFAEKPWYYFLISLGVSVLYIIIIGILLPFLIKLMKMEGTGESGMIFLIIIYHPLALVLAIFLKWLYLKVI